ncbi:MAG: DUF512 domain-containing protein [Thermoanaerobacterales bacterium]|nr:DUF512 domain-containing protein [Bacillota bacterium]MDI6907832.1 DUF512 domain-containing protein [Thermoanaerobacterales bacterium]
MPDRTDDGYLRALILRTVQEANILPLTSACNLSCLFCSHRQNPPGLDVYRLPPRPPEVVAGLAEWLDPQRPVVIGESATRIIEGEPLAYPGWAAVLRRLRERLPVTPIQVTTNGSLLTEAAVATLASLAGVMVYLSLNSASPEKRRRLMGDPAPERAVAAPALLARYRVPFHGSVVAMPHVTGWDDLRRTVRFLAASGAETVRVFLPGHTRYARGAAVLPPGLWERLAEFLGELRAELDVPLTMEPALLGDLRPEVAGVAKGSPAWRAGFKTGDVVESVAGKPVFSRVDAYRRLWRARDPEAVLRRGGERRRVRLTKPARASSGAVFLFDLDPRDVERVRQAAHSRRARRVLVLTGELAAPLLRAGLPAKDEGEPGGYTVAAVPNRFFGGSIACAGLLTVADLEAALREYLSHGEEPDLVLLPGRAFDHRRRDLTGRAAGELAVPGRTEVEVL